MSETIRFTVPLPPAVLRSNSRSHWKAKVRAKQAYSEDVWLAARDMTPTVAMLHYIIREDEEPMKRARVTYTWCYCGVAPDLSNLGANTKALQDILCMAPRSTQANGTTYLGLIEDDKGIVPEYRLKQVKHRAEQGVEIVIVRLDSCPDPAG